MFNRISPNSIELIVYDCDGVLTDNRVLLSENGNESVFFNRSDGLAISIIKKKGIKQLILTSEMSNLVELRAKKLDISAEIGIKDKKKFLEDYCKKNHILLKNVLFIGNDINDFQAMKSVGFPLCPSDAALEIKKIARYILPVKGGEGVVRMLIRYLFINSEYSKSF